MWGRFACKHSKNNVTQCRGSAQNKTRTHANYWKCRSHIRIHQYNICACNQHIRCCFGKRNYKLEYFREKLCWPPFRINLAHKWWHNSLASLHCCIRFVLCGTRVGSKKNISGLIRLNCYVYDNYYWNQHFNADYFDEWVLSNGVHQTSWNQVADKILWKVAYNVWSSLVNQRIPVSSCFDILKNGFGKNVIENGQFCGRQGFILPHVSVNECRC